MQFLLLLHLLLSFDAYDAAMFNNPFLSLSALLVIGVLVGVGLSSTLVPGLSTGLHLERFTTALLIALPLGLTAGYLKKF